MGRGFLIFGLIVFLISCERTETVTIPEVNPQDSINLIRESLNIPIKKEKFKDYFDSLQTHHLFNGNVLIAQRGQKIFSRCYGYANFKTKDTLKFSSTFQLASLSKQFTAIGILMLYDEGKLDLQDTIQKFFPNFPFKGITIHMMLTHRSGLPNYIYFGDDVIHNKTDFVSNQTIIELFEEFHPDWYYPPDVTFDYSNSGYMMLASIIEKVSKQSYEDYMQVNIFKPLEMNNTIVFNRNKNTTIPNQATGYLWGTKVAEDNFLNGIVGDKGIWSSVEDMYKWDQALYTNKLLSRETISLAFEPMGKDADSRENYGYGWRMYQSEDSMKVLYHGGWWQGFQNILIRLEKDSSTIVILKNKKVRHAINKEEIFDILYSN